MEIKELQAGIREFIKKNKNSLNQDIISKGEQLFVNKECTVLTQSIAQFDFVVGNSELYIALIIEIETFYENDEEPVERFVGVFPIDEEWSAEAYACLLAMDELMKLDMGNETEYKKYSREGMVRRVLAERKQKAEHADYRIKWAKNIYGDHLLTNENGEKYKVFLRDFDNETGYSNSKDAQVNKLGTTKHIMFAFNALKSNTSLFKRLKKQFPFIEVYCDPLRNYDIRFYYPYKLSSELQKLFDKYFAEDGYVKEINFPLLPQFFAAAGNFDNIVIRPEVIEKLNSFFEKRSLESLQQNYKPDFSSIKANLYDYQKEGITFATCRKHAIIADEMGLGKTIQAIASAVLKKEIFGFKKTLIVCPASLKAQWKKEIEKFSEENAEIIEGFPKERAKRYTHSEAYFLIINYETVLRDQVAINNAGIDFLILDEAQKVKNYATKSASAINKLDRKHVLIITGTPIENKLIDLFSIMTILDPHLLGPLWEFSYQHCLFDNEKPNKINAYYNLTRLNEQLKPVLLRREKRKVLDQLPNVQQQDVPIKMTSLQAEFHASYASGIGQIIRKKFLTPFDMQRLQQLLTGMRMVCDSTYLVDEATNDSPKLDELKYILLEKLDLGNSTRKVIIFSEWVKVHKLIGQMLLENKIGFAVLNGSVPVKKRGELIKQFEENPECKVFLSTEAGGSGLNLQVADILVNFELPWNPAKKNQRIGRIDRLGQKSKKLSIYNLITLQSIEQRIADGLLVKQNLFDSVLNEGHSNDFVDFTEKGRGQFLQQIKEMAGYFEESVVTDNEDVNKEHEIEALKEYTIEDFKRDHPDQYKIPFEEDLEDGNFSDIDEEHRETDKTEPESSTKIKEEQTGRRTAASAEQMEQVLNSGMEFLSGLMKMATGKDMGMKDKKIEVNTETGEVTMKFKLPGF